MRASPSFTRLLLTTTVFVASASTAHAQVSGAQKAGVARMIVERTTHCFERLLEAAAR